jgi:hypothetical protein
VLGFNKVSHIPILIDTADYKATTWSSAVFLRNQSKVIFLICINLKRLDIKIAKDARDFEGSVLEMFEIFKKVVVENEVRVVSDTIWILHRQIDHYAVHPHLR